MSNELNGKRVLWVEDDEFLGTIVEKKLLAKQCILTHVTTGEQALKYLDTNLVDIIVLDIVLPGMSGFEILKHIKSAEKLKEVPVVLLSNLNRPEDMEMGVKLGAERFLVKATLSLDDIVDQIADTLHKQ
ncbi:response regulator [Candidatus Parcubacteria bacterium]|nr:response regulator [Candidatus Parcubacteria bacterium]